MYQLRFKNWIHLTLALAVTGVGLESASHFHRPGDQCQHHQDASVGSHAGHSHASHDGHTHSGTPETPGSATWTLDKDCPVCHLLSHYHLQLVLEKLPPSAPLPLYRYFASETAACSRPLLGYLGRGPPLG